MNQEKVLKTLLAPVVSEKATLLSAGNNQYVFKVSNDSNKREIKAAIESLFNVDVDRVTTINVRGKNKIFKRKKGRCVNWKKAIVRIASGQMIDITSN